MASYNASKHALTALINTARAEYIDKNIFFSSFHPGDFDSTELDVGKINPNWAFNKYRWTKLSKVVNAALYVIARRKKVYIFPRYYGFIYRLLTFLWPNLIVLLCSKSIKKVK
jgi:short-subunit dehydrogenase